MASSIKRDLLNVPNSLTMLRIIFIPAVMWLIYLGDPLSCMYAALLFAAAAATDYVDGYIARKLNLVSITGKFLDPLADKLIVMAVLIILLQLGTIPAWLVTIVLAREISVTALRALASAEGIVMDAQSGGKYKTAFQLVGLIGMIAQYEYTIDWLLFSAKINFHFAGMTLFIISVVFSLWSGTKYFYDFLKGIDLVKATDS